MIDPLRDSKNSVKTNKLDRLSFQSIKPPKQIVIGDIIMILIVFITIILLVLFLYNKSYSKDDNKENNSFPEHLETSSPNVWHKNIKYIIFN